MASKKNAAETMVSLLAAIADSTLRAPDKIGRTEVGGLIISTVNTSDMGCETAILDSKGAHAVERYPDRDAAMRGHALWVGRAATLLRVTKLGYGCIAAKEIELAR